MNITADSAKIAQTVDTFSPDIYPEERMLALFSAVISFDIHELTQKTIQRAVSCNVSREALYEIILQSYLFLGFPRMLQAADCLQQVLPLDNSHSDFKKIEINEAQSWHLNGINLCKQIYQDKYEPLKTKVLEMAPEVFRWMVHEGYGKVLARKQLPIITRELSIIAFLMMENRRRQLHSHLHGAVNVGTSHELIDLVINDIGAAAGDGYASALELAAEIR